MIAAAGVYIWSFNYSKNFNHMIFRIESASLREKCKNWQYWILVAIMECTAKGCGSKHKLVKRIDFQYQISQEPSNFGNLNCKAWCLIRWPGVKVRLLKESYFKLVTAEVGEYIKAACGSDVIIFNVLYVRIVGELCTYCERLHAAQVKKKMMSARNLDKIWLKIDVWLI